MPTQSMTCKRRTDYWLSIGDAGCAALMGACGLPAYTASDTPSILVLDDVLDKV
jgi:PIN domain nuclease of toxin-antitoxin system